MKYVALLLTIFSLFTTNADAEPFFYKQQRRHVSAATIAGAAGMQVGFTATLVGLAMQIGAAAKAERLNLSSAERERGRKRAVTVTGIGLGLFVTGTVSLIGGVSADRRRNHPKLTLIVPKMNEVGLAFNF